jgi:hypothetical protein
VTLSVIRICRIAAHRRGVSAGTAGSLGVLWLVCAVLGVQLIPGVPVAPGGAAELAVVQVRDAAHNLRFRDRFLTAFGSSTGAAAVSTPPNGARPASSTASQVWRSRLAEAVGL